MRTAFFSRVSKTLVKTFVFAAFLLVSSSVALADPVGVSYTVSGSAGDWTLDFSFANNVNAGQTVYFMGVLLPAQNFGSIPSGFSVCSAGDCGATGTFNPIGFGGPNVTFNNTWLNTDYPGTIDGIAFGNSLAGFNVIVTTAASPTSVEWFAFSDGTTPYTGGGNFNSSDNPGFTGFATGSGSGTTPAPEPSSLLLLGSGLISLAVRRRLARN